jgi:hypothetical protein
MIFCVSEIHREILTIVEDRQPVRRREGSLFLAHQPDQVCLTHQLHELQRGTEVALVP